jgi:hypothetical protein
MRKKKYNENYFEKIDTEDKAYFLGLIASDGCVINNNIRKMLTLKLHTKDKHILEKMLSSIDSEGEIWSHKQRNMCEIKFSGNKILKDLEKYNIIQNKTKLLKYPEIDYHMEKHFIRGYFDGDGCIRINHDKRDGSVRGDLRIVSGSIPMLETINQKMNQLFNTNINKLYGPKDKDYKYIGWAGMTDIEKIYYGLYDNSNVYLLRKKEIFDNVIDVIKNKIKYRKK